MWRYATLLHIWQRGATLTVADGRCTLSVKTDGKWGVCDFAWGAFFKLPFGLGKCSFWLMSWQFFPGALKTTNFHRPHSVFTDFEGLENLIPFLPQTFKDRVNPGTTRLCCSTVPFSVLGSCDRSSTLSGLLDSIWHTVRTDRYPTKCITKVAARMKMLHCTRKGDKCDWRIEATKRRWKRRQHLWLKE